MGAMVGMFCRMGAAMGVNMGLQMGMILVGAKCGCVSGYVL